MKIISKFAYQQKKIIYILFFPKHFPKINTKKLKIQFDPNFKKASIYEQTLDSDGNNIGLSNNELMASVGMDGKYDDVNTSKYPGLDAALADKNSIVNKIIAKQIIITTK